MNSTVKRSGFEFALEQLKDVVGDKHVVCEQRQVEPYGLDTSLAHREPLAVVFPASSEEVSQIVVLANKWQLKLWPVSRGKNWGYGSAVPLDDNTVVISLERMNRIISVNEELAYAVIEPGVTYAQLNSYLKLRGLRLWCDTTDGPPSGSVIGNALEKGIGETPYGDHFGNLCGLEVVLPDGSIVLTGGGSADSQTLHTYKWGTGPYLEGLFSQSNFGIVTRAGIWLMPEPETFVSYTFELADSKQFSKLIDTSRSLALQSIIQTKMHIINDVVGLSIFSQYPDNAADSSVLSANERAQLRAKYGIAAWSFSGGLYGTKERVEADKRVLRRALEPLGKLTFVNDAQSDFLSRVIQAARPWPATAWTTKVFNSLINKLLGKPLEVLEAVPYVHAMLKGNPTEFFVRHAYFKSPVPKPDGDVDPPRDRCGLIWFAPVAPLASDNVNELLWLCEPLFAKHRFDFYVALLVTSPRSVVALFSIFYRQDSPDECRRANDLYEELCAVTEPAGYQQYRTGVTYTERILDVSPPFKALANQIKSQLDPNNVISPGRYGLGRSKISAGG